MAGDPSGRFNRGMKTKRTSLVGRIFGTIFGGLFAVVWIGGWSAGTLLFDVMFVRGAWKQYASQSWSEVQGKVVHSAVKTHSDSDGTSYSLELNYEYSVGNFTYRGTKDTELPNTMFGSSSVQNRVSELPKGKSVPVYYDPRDPTKAVLVRGITVRDIAGLSFMAMFMTPFNLVMLGSWYGVWTWMTGGFKRATPPRVQTFENGAELRIRLPHTTPFAWALIGLLAGSFGGIFVLAGANALTGRPEVNLIGWAVVLAIASIAYLRRAKQLEDGRYDLIVDGLRRNIVIPPADEKRETLTIKADELKGVTVERDETKDSDGDKVVKFTPTLMYGDHQRVRVITVSAEDEAETLATWLAGKLKTEYREGMA